MLFLGNYKYAKYGKTIGALLVNLQNISKLLLFCLFIIMKVTSQNNPFRGITSGDCYIFSMLEIYSKSQILYITTSEESNEEKTVFEIYPLIL